MAGKYIPGLYRTGQQKLAMGVWPWTEGLRSRLPLHYKKHYVEKFRVKPIPVHFIPPEKKYTVDKYGIKERIPDHPIPLPHIPEADMGLWGGESMVFGYRKRKNNYKKPSAAHLWKPRLFKRNLYSEILDKWMEITVTMRTLDLIDEVYGFDNYILKTHEVDLRSKLGMRLKREMLMTLAKRSMYPDNEEKCEAIYKKYKEFVIPFEEAEWVGLSLTQASKKLAKLENEAREASVTPHKYTYMQKLVEKYQSQGFDAEETGSRLETGMSSLKSLFGR